MTESEQENQIDPIVNGQAVNEPIVGKLTAQGPPNEIMEDAGAMQEISDASSESTSREPKRSRRKPKSLGVGKFQRFVSIGWSGAREPTSDLVWAEAHLEGNWVVVDDVDRVGSRKAILERLLKLKSALVTMDFNFSYPITVLDFIREREGIADWRAMIRTMREDLKKNADDGLRRWVELLGRYRESFLDPEVARGKLRHSPRFDDWGWQSGKRMLAPHEQRSFARRFRRTDALLREFGDDTMNTMQFGYNRLTSRYEFNGNIRGRDAVIGMAMLDQFLEGGHEACAVWPMMKPRKVTIVEVLPQLFTQDTIRDPGELEILFNNYEDAGWDISADFRGRARKSAPARNALLTLMGVMKTEERLFPDKRSRLPIRRYPGAIYSDPRVQFEGWIYGLVYRPNRQPAGPQSGALHSEAVPAA